jgi:hypothetical protein
VTVVNFDIEFDQLTWLLIKLFFASICAAIAVAIPFAFVAYLILGN